MKNNRIDNRNVNRNGYMILLLGVRRSAMILSVLIPFATLVWATIYIGGFNNICTIKFAIFILFLSNERTKDKYAYNA